MIIPKMKKFLKKEWEYWAEVAVSCAQITFGVFWATILLPRSSAKFVILVINGPATVVLFILGWLLVRRR